MKYIHYIAFSISHTKETLYTDFYSDNEMPTLTELKENIDSTLKKFNKFQAVFKFGIDNISTVLNE